MGVLGHPPDVFWRMSLYEFWQAFYGFGVFHGGLRRTATPREIEEAVRAMERFPAVITAEELEAGKRGT